MTAEDLLTERLRLRRWLARDEAPMAAINSDPEVARYLNCPTDEAAIVAFFGDAAAHWDAYGYGLYAVELLGADERFVGFAGFSHPTFIPAVADRSELGWRLARSAWGAGLATEAATAALDYGFATIRLAEVVSFTTTTNERSIAVMKRLAMTHDPADDFNHPQLARGNPLSRHVLYRISAERWRAAGGRAARRRLSPGSGPRR